MCSQYTNILVLIIIFTSVNRNSSCFGSSHLKKVHAYSPVAAMYRLQTSDQNLLKTLPYISSLTSSYIIDANDPQTTLWWYFIYISTSVIIFINTGDYHRNCITTKHF